MKIYQASIRNGNVEALLLIEPQEAARWDSAEPAVNAAIASYAEQNGLGMLLFPRVLDCDEQDDGAILLRFEAAVKPTVMLGQYKGLHTGVPWEDSERFAQTALEKASENAAMEIPALLVERRLDVMRLQRRRDVLGSVSYNTLADVYAILCRCNDELDLPFSPEKVWGMAMDTASVLSRKRERSSVDELLSLLAEHLYGEDFGEDELRTVGKAVEERLREREEKDAETAAEDLFSLYLRTRNQSEDEWRGEYRSTAAELVRTELMLDAVAEAEGLSVSPEEVRHEAALLAESNGLTPEDVLTYVGEETLRFQLLRSKAAALIVGAATE